MVGFPYSGQIDSLMFASYAQNFEDVMLMRALQNVAEGYYVDIGANDPKLDSVSLAFYERGWSGTNVEPDPSYAEKLRLERPRDTLVEAAIAGGSKSVKLHLFAGTGLTTSLDKYAELHHEEGHKSTEIVVPARTLESVFADIGARDIHWLKIDVEGMEEDVLDSWKQHSARPWIVVVEAVKPNSATPDHQRWEASLLERGYVFEYSDGLNRFYVHENHAALGEHFSAGPNLHDRFYLTHRSGFVPNLSGEDSIVAAELELERTAVLVAKAETQAAALNVQALQVQLEESAAAHHAAIEVLSNELRAEKHAGLDLQLRASELQTELEQSVQRGHEQAEQLGQYERDERALKQKQIDVRQAHGKVSQNLKDKINSLESTLKKERIAQAEVSEEMIELLSEADTATTTIHQLEHALAESSEQRDEAAFELNKLHLSTSWRLTAPVRSASILARKATHSFIARPVNFLRRRFDSVSVSPLADEVQQTPSGGNLHLTPDPEKLLAWQELLQAAK